MAKQGVKHIEVVNDEENATNANTPLIQKLLSKQLEHSLLISDLTNKLEDTSKIVHKILYYIENDHGTGQKGMVARLTDVEKKVDDHELFKNNFEGKIWGLSIAGGFVASFIGFVLNRLISKI